MNHMSKRVAWIDCLNALAALAVVYLHCSSYWSGPSQGPSWLTSNIVQSLFYFAVPVFFMNTGATLMDYRNRMTTKEFFRRRAIKTFLPFLFWSMISLIFYVFCLKKPIEWDALKILEGVINTRYARLYWFFPAVFACYFCIPVLSATKNRTKHFLYITACGILFVSTIPFICNLLNIRWNTEFTPPIVLGYIMYIVLGWLIACSDITLQQNQRYLVYALGFIGVLVHFLGTYFASISEGSIVGTYSGYTNLPCLLQTIAVYVWGKYELSTILDRGGAWAKLGRLFRFVAGLTYGIYLTHYYVLESFYVVFDIDNMSLLWQSLGPIVVFAISALITIIIKRTPLLKASIP